MELPTASLLHKPGPQQADAMAMLSAQLKLLLSAVHADVGIQVRRYCYFSPKTVGLDYKVGAGSGSLVA